MPFDYKKEYKEYYLPPKKPALVDIPPMNFVAVRGQGDPNEEDGEYKKAIGLLYGIAFTIKMSYLGKHKIDGYFSYVVPPLEGLWWQEKGGAAGQQASADVTKPDGQQASADTIKPAGPAAAEIVAGIDYSRKDTFHWISMIRLPDFVTRADFDWAVAEATEKKKTDFSKVEFFPYEEGACVQCMHIGPYDDEPATIRRMDAFAAENGYAVDITPERFHHEIYLSDPRRANPAKLKTVVRHPVKKV